MRSIGIEPGLLEAFLNFLPWSLWSSGSELFTGLYSDYWGRDAAIFRLMGRLAHIRTEPDDERLLKEPKFVSSHVIPDNEDREDNKVYFFFTEKALEAEAAAQALYARVGRVCVNDMGGQRMLVNKWTTFLKARLACSVPGMNGIDTHFDELEDIFLLQTRDNKNPVIFGLFNTTSNIFHGYAVCVYHMASIRAAFNGPYAHKEGPEYHWSVYEGKVPYPRPGSCASKVNGGIHGSTKDYPDEAIRFARGHPLMYQTVRPVHKRPILVKTDGKYGLKQIAVDRVEAEDGQYDVLFIGTDNGIVLKVITIYNQDTESMEEVILEELQVFKVSAPTTDHWVPSPILFMEISSKRRTWKEAGSSPRRPGCKGEAQEGGPPPSSSPSKLRGSLRGAVLLPNQTGSRSFNHNSVGSGLPPHVSVIYLLLALPLEATDHHRKGDTAFTGVVLKRVVLSLQQQIYVGSESAVAQVKFHQCDMYGSACADCCLARDPYCAWDGISCSRYYPTGTQAKRRFRRQDVRHGNAAQQCFGQQLLGDASGKAEERLVYGIEHNSTLLECIPRTLQAQVIWLVQRAHEARKEEVKADERLLKMDIGLLFLRLHRMDAGMYFCQTVEHSIIHTVRKITLEVVEEERVDHMFSKDYDEELAQKTPCPAQSSISHGSKPWYKEFLQLIGYSNFQRVEEYCEKVWCTDKKRRKLKMTPSKWKYANPQEKKARIKSEHYRVPRHTQMGDS
ncbi:hypothetical protein E2320_005760 [Naja naja]|nr:hypothetical protein E2320_005760 [Naja naja]